MHKRTTPEVFAHAKELRRELTPLERKLWAHLRAHRMKGVHFRAQHAIGNYVVDFSPEGDDVCSAQKTHYRTGR
jgi:very-short-patch-repair endonuclease